LVDVCSDSSISIKKC